MDRYVMDVMARIANARGIDFLEMTSSPIPDQVIFHRRGRLVHASGIQLVGDLEALDRLLGDRVEAARDRDDEADVGQPCLQRGDVVAVAAHPQRAGEDRLGVGVDDPRRVRRAHQSDSTHPTRARGRGVARGTEQRQRGHEQEPTDQPHPTSGFDTDQLRILARTRCGGAAVDGVGGYGHGQSAPGGGDPAQRAPECLRG